MLSSRICLNLFAFSLLAYPCVEAGKRSGYRYVLRDADYDCQNVASINTACDFDLITKLQQQGFRVCWSEECETHEDCPKMSGGHGLCIEGLPSQSVCVYPGERQPQSQPQPSWGQRFVNELTNPEKSADEVLVAAKNGSSKVFNKWVAGRTTGPIARANSISGRGEKSVYRYCSSYKLTVMNNRQVLITGTRNADAGGSASINTACEYEDGDDDPNVVSNTWFVTQVPCNHVNDCIGNQMGRCFTMQDGSNRCLIPADQFLLQKPPANFKTRYSDLYNEERVDESGRGRSDGRKKYDIPQWQRFGSANSVEDAVAEIDTAAAPRLVRYVFVSAPKTYTASSSNSVASINVCDREEDWYTVRAVHFPGSVKLCQRESTIESNPQSPVVYPYEILLNPDTDISAKGKRCKDDTECLQRNAWCMKEHDGKTKKHGLCVTLTKLMGDKVHEERRRQMFTQANQGKYLDS